MRLHAPAAGRNAAPILAALRARLPVSGWVLEVASGTGQHVAVLAAALPRLRFQPTEFDPAKLESIAAWSEGLPNVAAPLQLDVTAPRWALEQVDAVFCANMIHIAPEAVTEGLMRGAGEHLVSGGLLALYGPFRVAGQHTSPSNAAFDASLRSQDPRWGVRDLEWVQAVGRPAGLLLEQAHDMPANNKMLFFRREQSVE